MFSLPVDNYSEQSGQSEQLEQLDQLNLSRNLIRDTKPLPKHTGQF